MIWDEQLEQGTRISSFRNTYSFPDLSSIIAVMVGTAPILVLDTITDHTDGSSNSKATALVVSDSNGLPRQWSSCKLQKLTMYSLGIGGLH
jgi:hypothetical protein